ncbi:Panacea domain-containing protein [Phaeobacter italicus]|uniref:Panacea domain-containing protein n=1 Tax=Phaeobacter italicus TaxID=481446 RepID=UPI001C9732C8|nr:type II toxin-antitoxin system antitoxin SocA domain-containing protein [Phaeobacter italicus]MBY6044148.1 SocA family protein [Phaeobacter italicus]
MANYDALAIANEFITRNGGTMPQMKLQKLVYISNGWNLAINREPLVRDRFEAWDGGPVVRKLWNHIRDFGYETASGLLTKRGTSTPVKAELEEHERAVIDHVWKRYCDYSGLELSEMTHEPGTPWSNAYYGSGRNAVLPQTDIQQHFVELALAGRAQTA